MERKCILFQTNKIQEQILQIIGYSAMGIRRKRNCSPAIYSRCKFWGHINQAKSRSLGLTGLKSHSSPNTTRDLPPHCPRPTHRNIWWTLLPQNHDQNTLLLLAKNISSFSSIQYSWGWSRAVTAVAGLLLLVTFANLLLAFTDKITCNSVSLSEQLRQLRAGDLKIHQILSLLLLLLVYCSEICRVQPCSQPCPS